MQKVYRRKLSSGRMGYIVRALPKSTTSEVKCTAFPLSLVPLKNKGITRSARWRLFGPSQRQTRRNGTKLHCVFTSLEDLKRTNDPGRDPAH